jgi:hypothetical protein
MTMADWRPDVGNEGSWFVPCLIRGPNGVLRVEIMVGAAEGMLYVAPPGEVAWWFDADASDSLALAVLGAANAAFRQRPPPDFDNR